MGREPRVLTGLLERRAIEAAFDELNKTSEPELRIERAQAIAARGEPAVNALLALLDTPDPGLRGRLGLVATFLPRDLIIPALQGVAQSPERSDQARVAALSLLDRYLGEATDNTGYAPLSNPDAAAVQSLHELVFAMNQEPLAILDFMEQLAEQAPEVADLLVDAAASAPRSPHIVTLLRLLAQEENQALARRALDQLSHTRFPEAVAALLVLARVLPPGQAEAAERAARKLRFSGVSFSTPDGDGPFSPVGTEWRVLLSPVDPDGVQFVWFIGERPAENAVFLTLLLNDPAGILNAAIALDIPPDRVPRRGPVGTLLNVDTSGGESPVLILLEVPWEEGVALVRQALERHWEAHNAPPVAFRVMAPLIFGFELDQPAGRSAEAEPVEALQEAEDVESDLVGAWFAREREALARGLSPDRVFPPAVCASYVRRLRTMARWLKMAGEVPGAAYVEGLAQHLATVSPLESPFIKRLCEPSAGSAE